MALRVVRGLRMKLANIILIITISSLLIIIFVCTRRESCFTPISYKVESGRSFPSPSRENVSLESVHVSEDEVRSIPAYDDATHKKVEMSLEDKIVIQKIVKARRGNDQKVHIFYTSHDRVEAVTKNEAIILRKSPGGWIEESVMRRN